MTIACDAGRKVAMMTSHQIKGGYAVMQAFNLMNCWRIAKDQQSTGSIIAKRWKQRKDCIGIAMSPQGAGCRSTCGHAHRLCARAMAPRITDWQNDVRYKSTYHFRMGTKPTNSNQGKRISRPHVAPLQEVDPNEMGMGGSKTTGSWVWNSPLTSSLHLFHSYVHRIRCALTIARNVTYLIFDDERNMSCMERKQRITDAMNLTEKDPRRKHQLWAGCLRIACLWPALAVQ